MLSASAVQTNIQSPPSDSCEPGIFKLKYDSDDIAMREDKITIPDEILLVIFRDALPPSWRVYYHENLAPFHRSFVSCDLETKLTIIQVCKTWYRIGARTAQPLP
ncbi:hypothetical protein R3P38DRAFT_3127413 [Favolaschia claudopus]|uniref:F-box domain-containing protein n=1 Tax=Favolaschia claudopus TaxID=2862362 RepID=A0AAV9ZAG5_9AGAR